MDPAPARLRPDAARRVRPARGRQRDRQRRHHRHGRRERGRRGRRRPPQHQLGEARQLYLEARAVAEQLRAHEGRKLYEQAAAADPTFAMAHYQLAINSATAKDFLEHMKEAVALSDRASEGERLFILAAEAGGNANPAKALEYQEELVAKYPRTSGPTSSSATAYFGRQEYDKAIEQYHAATEINPSFSPAYNLLGYAYRSLEQYDSAEAAFKKYIELIPGDPNPYDSYAELLLKMGRFDESIAQYRKALEHDSNFVASKVGIATNLMYQGKHRRARPRWTGSTSTPATTASGGPRSS